MRSAIIELSAAGSLSPSRTFEPIRRQRGIAHRFDTRRLHSACKIRRPGNQRAGPDFHSQGLAHHQHLPSAAFKHPRLKPGKLCCAAAVPCPSISPTRRLRRRVVIRHRIANALGSAPGSCQGTRHDADRGLRKSLLPIWRRSSCAPRFPTVGQLGQQ